MKKSLLFILISFICINLIGCTQETEVKPQVEEKPIKSCILYTSEQESSYGSFVLGVGSYYSSSSIQFNYYIYMQGLEGFVLQDLDAENVEIVETNEKSPCIKGFFDSSGRIFKCDYEIGFEDVEGLNKYVIYVPEGYIKEDYSNNLKENINN